MDHSLRDSRNPRDFENHKPLFDADRRRPRNWFRLTGYLNLRREPLFLELARGGEPVLNARYALDVACFYRHLFDWWPFLDPDKSQELNNRAPIGFHP
jgi:hypothetical protein